MCHAWYWTPSAINNITVEWDFVSAVMIDCMTLLCSVMLIGVVSQVATVRLLLTRRVSESLTRWHGALIGRTETRKLPRMFSKIRCSSNRNTVCTLSLHLLSLRLRLGINFLGKRWHNSRPMAMALCFYMCLDSPTPITLQFLSVYDGGNTNRTAAQLVLSLIFTCCPNYWFTHAWEYLIYKRTLYLQIRCELCRHLASRHPNEV